MTKQEKKLLKAAKQIIKVYPYNWQECLKEKSNCKMCNAQKELVEAVALYREERKS